MRFKHILGPLYAASISVVISVVLAGHALAQDNTVKIGALYPMSGNSASVGAHAKAAIETAVDIINNAHPELGDFPLAGNAGLAGLGGAKVEVVFADSQGSPATGQNQALRLITQDKVMVTPAPGEPGKMPFWHGDRPGRPLEFGMHVGKLSRELVKMPHARGLLKLSEMGLDEADLDELRMLVTERLSEVERRFE